MRRFTPPVTTLARLRAGFAGALAATTLATTAVSAQGVEPAPPADFASGADALRPGQYIWTPDVAPAGEMVIYVDLTRQLAAVYRGGARIGVTTISSGKAGHETPTGVFTILQKDAKHHSNKYDDAPMPFQQRLTWDGVALHAGGVPGYPESHGCVHLPYGFAKALFRETRIGMTVVMERDAIDPAQDVAASQVASAATIEETPQRSMSDPAPDSPVGPATSKRD